MSSEEFRAMLRKNPQLSEDCGIKREQFKVKIGVTFTVFGQPVPKPRMTQSDKWKKRPCVIKYRAWADKARASFLECNAENGVFESVTFKAYFEIPKSYSKKKREELRGQPHRSRGDGDNILKSIQDALFKEDCFIWKFSGEKRWDDGKGARVEIDLC